jgi:hypothetical protein
MFQTKIKYNYSSWEDSQTTSLRLDNLNLTNELVKLKRQNESLQKEKKELEVRLSLVQKNDKQQSDCKCFIKDIETDIHLNRLEKWLKQPQLPDDIEKIMSKVEVNVKKELYPKIEDLLNLLTCVVCSTNLKTVAYSSCRHLAACDTCSKNLDDTCLLCRKVSEKVTIYL